jgi:hypothetical protein
LEGKETHTNCIPLTHIHDGPLFWFSTGTSIESGRVKLVLYEFSEEVLPAADK